MTLHVVQYSGGIGSWAAAQRVAAAHGTADMVLLFADTHAEDPDLYRFLADSARQLNLPITTVADGRTPFQVFADERYLGNSRLAPCTWHLKIKPCRGWLWENADPEDTVLYVGIDHTEADRRTPGITAGWNPWTVQYPMTEPPHLTKDDMQNWARSLGVHPTVMYERGFSHANCAGACVRAGQTQWRHLADVHPDRYAAAEAAEEALRAELGDVAILRRIQDGRSRPLTLRQLREEHAGGTR